MRDRMAGVRNRNPAHGVDGPPPQCNLHSPNHLAAHKKKPRHPELGKPPRDTSFRGIPLSSAGHAGVVYGEPSSPTCTVRPGSTNRLQDEPVRPETDRFAFAINHPPATRP